MKLRLFFFLVLAQFFTLSVMPITVEIEGICYKLNNKTGEAEVVSNTVHPYSGDIEIPETIDYEGTEYLVTSVGEQAFFCLSSVTSVTFPNSIRSIGHAAFWGCQALDSIALPEKVTVIADDLFADCEGLKRVVLPDSITYIGNSAFNCCFSLDSLFLPNTVETIEDWAFTECRSLSFIEIPTNLKYVGTGNFGGCSSMKSVIIKDLSAWCSINFGNNGYNWGTNPTANPLCNTGKLILDGEEITDLVIPDDVTSIGRYAFNPCGNFTSLTIGEHVSDIGYSAFRGCSKLTSVICLPRKVPHTSSTVFNDDALENCTLYVPESAINEYMKAEPWCNFKEIVSLVIPKHSFSYYVDGQLYKTIVLEEGEYITPEPYLEKEGYTFSGWSEIPEVMPDHDVMVTGSFAVNQYSVKFIVDGEVVSEQNLDYGAAIVAPEIAEKEGHSFSGWSELPETVPAKDVTVTGSFTINQYTLTFILDGVVVYEQKLDYGTTIVVPEVSEKNGYTFSGWGEVAEKIPAHDVIYSASYILNGYVVKFVIDGEVISEETMTYGAEITAPAIPNKQGYTFSGWDNPVGTVPANDITFTGSFIVNGYKATFTVDGAVYNVVTVEYGSPIAVPDAPTKEGYTFSGWNEVPETMPATDVAITGTFVVNKYKVAFIADGRTVSEQSIAFGQAIPIPANPTKEGHTFDGWTPAVAATMPAQDVTYYAKYSVNQYMVKFVANGVVIDIALLEFGAPVTTPVAPAKEGYTFLGWGEDATVPAKDVTYTATYAINQYTVKFIVDGETISEQMLDYGTAITAPAVPNKQGFAFSGWDKAVGTVPANDITFTGSFVASGYTITFLVDGVEFLKLVAGCGAAITVPAAPTKEGYTFNGWSEVPATMPAQDIIVTGSYSINQYTLKFVIDGTIISEQKLDYGSVIAAPTAPEKEGYTFQGWVGFVPTMPAQDITVTGSYSVNSYKITYILDGVQLSSVSVRYGAVINLPSVGEKEGYTFSGWGNVPETMPAEDLIIIGNFTVNKYLVTFIADGQNVQSVEMAYGTPITAPMSPTKEGYTFTGWGNVDATVPAHDVTYTATYRINSYYVRYYVDNILVAEDKVEFGAEVVLRSYTPENSDRYTFIGWIGLTYETMPAHDIEYHANIVDGINGLMIGNLSGVQAIYDANGRRLSKAQRGVSIFLMSDGTKRKVLVK